MWHCLLILYYHVYHQYLLGCCTLLRFVVLGEIGLYFEFILLPLGKNPTLGSPRVSGISEKNLQKFKTICPCLVNHYAVLATDALVCSSLAGEHRHCMHPITSHITLGLTWSNKPTLTETIWSSDWSILPAISGKSQCYWQCMLSCCSLPLYIKYFQDWNSSWISFLGDPPREGSKRKLSNENCPLNVLPSAGRATRKF